LNRYLQELKLYSYIQVIGGNKHREGFIYKLTNFGNQNDIQSRIEQDLQKTLEAIRTEHEKQKKQESKPVSQKKVSNPQTQTA
jgi:hypothetical protein